MKYKDTKKYITIEIDKRSLSEKGIYIRTMKKLECKQYNNIFKKYVIDKGQRNFTENCKLSYDFKLRKYYFYVVFKKEKIMIPNRKHVAALDPGERIFNVYTSEEEYGKIGDNARIKIIKIKRKIQKLQSILDKNKNKHGKTIKHKRYLINQIQMQYNNIKGYVNEIHKKGAKYLCENYEKIMIPEFKSKPMISNKKRKEEYARIRQIENREEAKKALKELNKKAHLSAEVKFVLQNLSHYKFRNFLVSKAKEYGTELYVIDEHYTSQTCIKCGKISKEYDNLRMKTCPYCKYKINRDLGGSRNNLCKALVQMDITVNGKPL